MTIYDYHANCIFWIPEYIEMYYLPFLLQIEVLIYLFLGDFTATKSISIASKCHSLVKLFSIQEKCHVFKVPTHLYSTNKLNK